MPAHHFRSEGRMRYECCCATVPPYNALVLCLLYTVACMSAVSCWCADSLLLIVLYNSTAVVARTFQGSRDKANPPNPSYSQCRRTHLAEYSSAVVRKVRDSPPAPHPRGWPHHTSRGTPATLLCTRVARSASRQSEVFSASYAYGFG